MTASRTLILLAVAGCASVGKPCDTPASHLPRRIVLVGAWSNCSGGEAGAELVEILSREMRTLAPLLRDLAKRDAEVCVLDNPEPGDLLTTLAKDNRPLWFIYNGVGSLQSEQSYLCLRNGQLAVDQIIKARPPDVPYATYLINGCHSAYVDPRKDNTVVISAGPELVGNNPTKTVLGQDLIAGLTNGLDLDGNGILDSRELFVALDRVHVRQYPVAVKMRSQSWRPLPLFSLRQADISAQSVLPGDLVPSEADFRAGRSAPPVSTPAVRWWIPNKLDGLEHASMRLTRIDSSKTARAIAAVSMATLVIGIEDQFGSLIARDLGTNGVLWRRPVDLSGGGQMRDWDIEEILHGFEALDGGRVRRYVNPLTASQREELEAAHFVARPCRETTGQCFERISMGGGPP